MRLENHIIIIEEAADIPDEIFGMDEKKFKIIGHGEQFGVRDPLMKYIITDKNEVRVGNGYHFELAEDCIGKVVSAGHFLRNNKFFQVFGASIYYRIEAKPEDALILKEYFQHE